MKPQRIETTVGHRPMSKDEINRVREEAREQERKKRNTSVFIPSKDKKQ